MILRDTEVLQADGTYTSTITDYAWSDTATTREFQTFRDVLIFTNRDDEPLTISYDGAAPVILAIGESVTVEKPLLQYTVTGGTYTVDTFRYPIFNRGVEIDLSAGDYTLSYTDAHVDALVVTVGHATNDIIVPFALLPILTNKVYAVANRDPIENASIKAESGTNTVVVGPNSTSLVRVNMLATEIERGTTDAPIT